LRASGAVIDFRRIRRIGSGLGPLADSQFDLSRFNEASGLKQGPDDGFAIVVKSICVLREIESEQLQKEMRNLMNLQHPRIACPIGFVLPSGSQSQWRGFEIVRLYCLGDSLSEVISVLPEWRTPTAQAKAIVGLVLGGEPEMSSTICVLFILHSPCERL
jgi:hypothetical protein